MGLAVVALGGAAVIPVAASSGSGTGGDNSTTITMDVSGPSTTPCGDGAAQAWTDDTSIAMGDRACWRVAAQFGDGPITDASLTVGVPAGLRVVSWAIGSGSTTSGFDFDASGPTWRLTDAALQGARAEIVIETIVDDPRQVADGDALTPAARVDFEAGDAGPQLAIDDATVRVSAARLAIDTVLAPKPVAVGETLDMTTTVSNTGSLPATVTFRTNLDAGLSCLDVTSTDGGTCVDGTSGSYVEWVDVPIDPDGSADRDVHVLVPERFPPGRVIENCGEVIRFVTPTADGTGFVTVTSPFGGDPDGPNADSIEDCD
ncbi:MAG: hypothetical protein AAGG08_06390, partial [Actinomycetota bacterium]